VILQIKLADNLIDARRHLNNLMLRNILNKPVNNFIVKSIASSKIQTQIYCIYNLPFLLNNYLN